MKASYSEASYNNSRPSASSIICSYVFSVFLSSVSVNRLTNLSSPNFLFRHLQNNTKSVHALYDYPDHSN